MGSRIHIIVVTFALVLSTSSVASDITLTEAKSIITDTFIKINDTFDKDHQIHFEPSDPEMGADTFAAANGTIFIGLRLLKQLLNEPSQPVDECVLRWIVGHEMSHLLLNHAFELSSAIDRRFGEDDAPVAIMTDADGLGSRIVSALFPSCSTIPRLRQFFLNQHSEIMDTESRMKIVEEGLKEKFTNWTSRYGAGPKCDNQLYKFFEINQAPFELISALQNDYCDQ